MVAIWSKITATCVPAKVHGRDQNNEDVPSASVDAIDAALQTLPLNLKPGDYAPLDNSEVATSPKIPWAWRVQALAHKASLALLEHHTKAPDTGIASLRIKVPQDPKQAAKPGNRIYADFMSELRLHMDGRV